MADGLKVGDLTTCVVTDVRPGLALVSAKNTRGIIRGVAPDRYKVGDRIHIRVSELEASRFVGVPLES